MVKTLKSIASEKFIVAFWRDSSSYPNAVYNSIDDRMRVYWKCIATFAHSLRRYHKSEYEICVATNDVPPEDLSAILDGLEVERIQVPFQTSSNNNSANFGAAWYLIDVISHVSVDASDDQVLVFIDPDCLISGPLGGMVAQVRKTGLLLHEVDYPKGKNTNGVSREGLREIAMSCDENSSLSLPIWIGGELIAGTGECIRSLVVDIEKTRNLLEDYCASTRIYTEEHFLSLVCHFYPRNYVRAHPEHISRIWTTGRYRNYSTAILDVPIWHLPSEKNRGFPRALDFLENVKGKPIGPNELEELSKIMSLRGPTLREIAFVLRSSACDLASLLRGKIGNYRRG